jgi:hypothetical protein
MGSSVVSGALGDLNPALLYQLQWWSRDERHRSDLYVYDWW